MAFVESFRGLEVYKLSRRLSKEIFDISRQFPKEEMFSLTDQVRRSSRSVGAQIAEAWAKRKYQKHFISKLTDADGEQLETQHGLRLPRTRLTFPLTGLNTLLMDYAHVGNMLNSMMIKASSFVFKFQEKIIEVRTG